MQYDPYRHHRRSIRLQGYDYTRPGAYFATLCVQGRACLLGEVVAGEMNLSEAGTMVEVWWRDLSRKFPTCNSDAFVVMPNHLHGVLELRADAVGADRRVRPGAPLHPCPSLSQIVQWFKTMTTNAYLRGVHERGWSPFVTRLWQRGFYDHVIRDDGELTRILTYIAANPANWSTDPDNPAFGQTANRADTPVRPYIGSNARARPDEG